MAGSSVPDVTSKIGGLFQAPQQPSLMGPDSMSAQPTLAQTSTTALQKQLTQEHAAASTSTLLTGGQGLLDDPKTTSNVLMGA